MMTDSQQDTQNDFLDSLLSDFLDESDQLIAQLNENLLQLDEWVQSLDEGDAQKCDAELMNEMFRAAHSIKGLSAMLGLSDINTLTHKIENVFDAARNDQLAINADVVDLVFTGLDRLTGLVELLKEPDAEPVDCEVVLTQIEELLRSAGAERQQASQAEAEQAMAGGVAEVGDTPVALPDDPLDGLTDDDDIPDKYLAIFIDEAELSLDELSASLMTLEAGGRDNLRSPLATAHKIKGSAASIGLNRAAKLAHLMEDLLEEMVQSQGSIPAETADLLLRCTGALQQHVDDLRKGPADSTAFVNLARQLAYVQSRGVLSDLQQQDVGVDQPLTCPSSLSGRLESVVSEIRERLQSMESDAVASATGLSPAAVQYVQAGENMEVGIVATLASYLDQAVPPVADDRSTPAPPAERVAAQSLPSETGRVDSELNHAGSSTYVGHVQFEPGLKTAVLKAQLIYEKLNKLGKVIDAKPMMAELDELEEIDSVQFRLVSNASAQIITSHVRVAGVQEVRIRQETGDVALPEQSDAMTAERPSVTANEPKTAASEAPLRSDKAAGKERSNSTSGPVKTDAAVIRAKRATKSSTEMQKPRSEAKPPSKETGKRPAETVRVGIDRLDQLMDLTGQLVINKSQFIQIGQKLTATLDSKQLLFAFNKVIAELDKIDVDDQRLDNQRAAHELQQLRGQVRRTQTYLPPLLNELGSLTEARELTRDLGEAIHQLGLVSDGLQQGVMETRMVPVGPLFTRFRRVVRDITRANGKQVQLVIHGEKTELDKRMIDELGDPLVHMVRNSADHGIELPAVREAAGKPGQGTVTLNAYHRGNSIVIEVCDDGKGLDTGRILGKCVEKGILTTEEAEKMTPQQIHQMIWEPGLTTAEKVTDVSGRGMGMDIVKSKIEDLNGTVDIESVSGQGTTITIKLPLTLAILPSLMVEMGGDVFAMPLEAVVEIVSVRDRQLSTVHGQQTALVRDRVVSVVQLSDALSFHELTIASQSSNNGAETLLVILGEQGQEIGLVVDRVVNEEDIVIKSIAENFKNIRGIAGASILGDGRVSLILDAPALIEMVSQNSST